MCKPTWSSFIYLCIILTKTWLHDCGDSLRKPEIHRAGRQDGKITAEIPWEQLQPWMLFGGSSLWERPSLLLKLIKPYQSRIISLLVNL